MKRLFSGTALCSLAAFLLLSGCETTSLDDGKSEINVIRIDNSAAARAMLDSDGNVDTGALQNALDVFDSENEQEPYFIASAVGNASGQRWTLSYGKGAGRNAGLVFKKGIENGFDAINLAMRSLPHARNTKLKILVDSDLYSGESFTSDGSSEIQDVANLYSIEVLSRSILDFGGHTLYAQNSVGDNIVPISITNKQFASVRNLTIKGHARYAIWCQGCDNMVFDNIRIELDNDEKVKNLGLRIAEKGSTWGTNIYVDNIYATGCRDNAVETMKVDGIYIGTVTGVDNYDCALLFNTTTNAVVGTVNGTRCSPRASKGVYAAFRTANFVGPDVYVHKINAVECGRGYFSVSANSGISIDEFNAENCYAQAALIQDTQGLVIKSGRVKAGNNSTDTAFRLTNGSDGGKLDVMNNTFRNIKIEGYAKCFVEDEGKSDWNTFVNCTTDGSSFGPHSLTKERETHSETSIEISRSTTEIAAGAYMNYTALTSVTIPKSVKKIGKNAFYGCENLSEVKFEEGSELSEIGSQAFGGTSIKSVVFPSSVRVFGSNIMGRNCESVEITSKKIDFMASCAFFNLADPSELKAPAKSGCLNHIYDDGIIFGMPKLEKGTEKATWYFWYSPLRTALNSSPKLLQCSP